VPTYDYECLKCNKPFSAEQRIVDPPLTECPNKKCKGEAKRLISATSFVLKGSGWEKDGY